MIRRWHDRMEFADGLLARELERSGLEPQDRAFAQELFYGVLRNRSLLDFWIGQVRRGKLEPVLRYILRLGFYQLFLLSTPAHAAVYETVSLARKGKRGLVNAILRQAQRDEAKLRAAAEEQPVAVRFSHPPSLVEKWMRQFGQETTLALCQWNNQPAPVYLRRDHEFVRLEENPTALTGRFYIQDPSTAIAPQLLAPQPNELVLDACAAPGGKTSLLAEQIGAQAKLVAADRDAARLQRLRENLTRLGLAGVRVVQVDWQQDRPPFPPASFDKILLDVPCSNSGVLRRRVDLRWRWEPENFLRMPMRQLAILEKVASLLKPDGALVYSTCSLEPEENEDVVEKFLRQHPAFRLAKSAASLPWRDGFDGAFAARLEKSA